MKLKYTLTMLFFTISLTTITLAYPHAEPPRGDPSLTNRFGRSWSEPIYTGYLIVDGQYIEAPYIVEQRGYRTMVNGIQVGTRDQRSVLPLPPPPAVTEDPGIPNDLTENSTLGEALRHPVTVAKRRYWDYIDLKGQERLNLEKAYFSSLPCVARVDDTGQPGVFDSRRVVLYDHTGDNTLCMFRLSPTPPKVQLSDEVLYKYSRDGRRYTENSLRGRMFVFAGNGTVGAMHPPGNSSLRWQNIFETMAGDLSPAEKLRKLKHLGLVSKNKSLKTAESFYPVTYFQPTAQLWQRLKNDDSWKESAEERLYALTNGWKNIEPAFLRTNIVVVANTTAVKQITTLKKTVQHPPVKPKVKTSKPPAITDTEPSPDDTTIPRRSPAAIIFLLIAIVALIITAIFIIKRRK